MEHPPIDTPWMLLECVFDLAAVSTQEKSTKTYNKYLNKKICRKTMEKPYEKPLKKHSIKQRKTTNNFLE